MRQSLSIAILLICFSSIIAQSVSQNIPGILNDNKELLGINTQDLNEYAVTNAYTTEHLGITHVYVQQRYADIPLYNGILNLNLAGERIMSFGNSWISGLATNAPSASPDITARTAVEIAANVLGLNAAEVEQISTSQNALGQVTRVTFTRGELSRVEITAELMWVRDEKAVLLCWNVGIEEINAENVWSIFIDAHARRFVRKDNFVQHCSFDPLQLTTSRGSAAIAMAPLSVVADSSYNVFAMPVESPNHGTRSIVTRPWLNAGANNDATTLGWHRTGTNSYTITRGNNVHAYEDIDHNNIAGYSPDTANLRFDYPFDPELDPEDNVAAAITNLFYWNNMMHDVMYQYGFNEVSGNFQVNNLGRGGNGNDDVRAEGLDGGGLNNANFFTPSDGSRPRMQMYLWSPVPETSPLIINSPEAIVGAIYAIESDFSNSNKLADVGLTTGDLVLVDDDGADTHEACGMLSNATELVGKVAVIDRGNCDFVVKVKRAQLDGAIAAIVVNNVSGGPFAMGGTDNTIVIPAVMISLDDGNTLKAVMESETVNVSMDEVPTITPDGDYDSGVIAHEYGHGISTRLTGGPSNVGCLNNNEQMGEGWSDFFGLMMTTDWATASPDDPRGIGTYVLGESTDGTGIRTYPYTPDTTINPFTYADVADAPLINGSPSPHFIGSIWCTMLWDMTWNIIEMTPADPDMYGGSGGNNIALQLVIDGLKLQPCSPGFVDGRNAILLADQMLYDGQYSCAIWNAFAGRGLGVGANQGSSGSHTDGIASFVKPEGIFLKSTSDVSPASEGQEVMFTLQTVCGCEGKSNLEISDILSDDMSYIAGSGGVLNGNTIEFTADTLAPLDTLEFSYHATLLPCTAVDATTLSSDNAEGSAQYESIKLQGSGTKVWVTSTSQSASPTHSWDGRDYTTFANFALTLMDPIPVNGPVEITFDHRYETEATYDGGVVEYSLNDGLTWIDAGPYFIENGYPDEITTVGTNSPIAGQEAFTGDSDDQFGITGFVHSVILLNITGAQNLLLRFRFACDGSVGGPGINGWYVDNIFINQISGITNQTRVAANGILVDSLYHSLATTKFIGNVLYVDPDAIGDQSGTTWPNAMRDLPLALQIAGCGEADSMFVVEGTYVPTASSDRQTAFTISDSTAVFGGFPTGGSSFAARDPLTHPTILSGDIGDVDDATDNSYHVLFVDSGQKAVILDGVTIANGNANGTGDNSAGAAVFCRGGAVLRNVIFMANHGETDGQLVRIRDAAAQLQLQDCTLYAPSDEIVKLLNSDSGKVIVTGNTQILHE